MRIISKKYKYILNVPDLKILFISLLQIMFSNKTENNSLCSVIKKYTELFFAEINHWILEVKLKNNSEARFLIIVCSGYTADSAFNSILFT